MLLVFNFSCIRVRGFLGHIRAYSMVLWAWSITPTILKMISPYSVQIFFMQVGCAQKVIMVPPIRLISVGLQSSF